MTIMTVFRSRLNPGVETEYGALTHDMSELAKTMPGFLEEKTFAALDGERVTIVLFADRASHVAWRDHPQHRLAQETGRSSLYAEYHVFSAEIEYEHLYDGNAVR